MSRCTSLSWKRRPIRRLIANKVFSGFVTACRFATREFHEANGWVDELADSAAWRRCFQYRFRRAAHINVLEMTAIATLLRRLAVERAGSRPVMLTDSRVALGALGMLGTMTMALTIDAYGPNVDHA